MLLLRLRDSVGDGAEDVEKTSLMPVDTGKEATVTTRHESRVTFWLPELPSIGVGRINMEDLDVLPPTITVEHAGDLLGLSRSAAYRAADRGELPTIRFGRRLFVPTPKLLALLGLSLIHI